MNQFSPMQRLNYGVAGGCSQTSSAIGAVPDRPVRTRVVFKPWEQRYQRYSVEAEWFEGNGFGSPIAFAETQEAAEETALALIQGSKVVAEFTAVRSAAEPSASSAASR
jgi:hypothetical protein